MDIEQPPPPPPTLETEAAKTRRRWINLAELLAVAAVIISGLTLWNSYRERVGAEADKAAERQQADAAAEALLLRGTPDREGERLSLAPADAGQTIQTQRIAFPAAFGTAPVEMLSDPRIEARWVARALLRARGDAAEDRSDKSFPVQIVTSFYSGGVLHRDSARYAVGYRIEGGGLLSGHRVRLLGLSLAAPGRR